ncbi:MAG: hypothetical protein QM760_15995 [Nibricoccus sp.]
MKTHQEIQTEARQLMALGGQFLSEQRTATNAAVLSTSRTLFQFPSNLTPAGSERHIDAAIGEGALVFRLVERDTNASQEDSRSETLLASSSSANDVLSTGYELAEEERLAVELEPYAERSEETENPADGETVSCVEAILESRQLAPVDRFRTKAEIVEFLEGRLDPSEMISRHIERQCAREGVTEKRDLKLVVSES